MEALQMSSPTKGVRAVFVGFAVLAALVLAVTTTEFIVAAVNFRRLDREVWNRGIDQPRLRRGEVEERLRRFAVTPTTIADVPTQYQNEAIQALNDVEIFEYSRFGFRVFVGYSAAGEVELFVPCE